jgi:hypothetical protein
MRCPFAIWEPVVNESPLAIQHVGCVIHVTAGESNPWSWFNQSVSQASSHFFIGNGQGAVPDGQLYEFVDCDQTAWAEVAGNASYVSVETEGQPTEALTNNQILTFARLLAWLHLNYGIPLLVVDTPGQAGLITHGDGGVAWGDHIDCPGPLRSPQRGAICYIAALSLKPTPTPQEAVNMQAYDPVTGGVWTLGADGHIEGQPEGTGGPPWLGSLQNNRFGWQQQGPIAGFTARKTPSGIGYDVAVGPLAQPNPDGTWYNHYTFPRSGALKLVAATAEEDMAVMLTAREEAKAPAA